MIQMNTPDTDNAQEIDLIELAKRLWGERKFIFKCCGIAVVVGLVVAFSIPKEYSTTVKLAPETSDPSKKMGNLGGLAAMAGINLNSTSGADAISPDLYPDVVSSIPFLLELFPVQVTNEKGDYSASLYDYMDDHQKSAWWSYVVQAPFKLLGVVKDLFSKEEPVSSGELTSFRLTNKQAGVINALQQRISASVDKKTSVITVSVQMQDPLISANITQIVLEKLQGYITNYRTQKVKQDLEFTEKVFSEARESYYKAQ
ncbi:Wzz/FepE/Etk N-terminal domain-containing protein, partial [Parabacteroides sp.]